MTKPPKKKFISKQSQVKRERPQKIVKTFSHPHLEKELEETRKSFQKLLSRLKDSDLSRRPSQKSWSVKEHLIVAGSNLWLVIPKSLNNYQNGKRGVRLNKKLGHILNFLSIRLSSRNETPGSIAKKYEDAHSKVLTMLSKMDDEELKNPVFTLTDTFTIHELFRHHTRHFREHEAEIKKLLAK